MFYQRIALGVEAESLGERIKRLRQAAQLSQSELGRMVGVSHQMVWQWEKGKRSPRPVNQVRLADALGVSLAYLWTGKELAEEVPSVPPELVTLYALLGPLERRTWLQIGHSLRELHEQYEAVMEGDDEPGEEDMPMREPQPTPIRPDESGAVDLPILEDIEPGAAFRDKPRTEEGDAGHPD